MNNETALTDIQAFMNNYRQFVKVHQSLKLQNFMNGYERLRSGLSIINKLYGEINRLSPPSFNIFHLLRVGYLENRTHSTILADFLNPNGSHGQGPLFLKTFLKVCSNQKSLQNESFPIHYFSSENNKWFVDQEKITNFGRMDLVISNATSGQLLVIENKIYAGEQRDQIYRYSQWVKSNTHYPTGVVLYLTIAGDKATTDKGFDYFRISYKETIKKWLENSLVEITAQEVKVILKQYINLIKTL